MADEKTPSQAPPSDDLKARLRLSSKSLRQQQQEEEERRKAEEDAKKKAEADKVRRQKERQDQFSLAGGSARTEWSSHWEVPSEEELKKLEALPQHGRHRHRLLVGIIFALALAATLGFGYYFGRAFFGRSLENSKIEEARELIEWQKSRQPLFDAIADHKKKIDELVEAFAKPNITPQFQLQKLYEFIAHCEAFLEANKPFTAREMFGAQIRNPEVATEVIGFIDALNRMFMMTDQVLREKEILMLIGTGEASEDQTEEKRLVNVVFEPDARGEGDTKLPWNKGDVIAIPEESWKQLTRVDPEPGPDGAAPTGGPRFTMPVLKGLQAEKIDVDTAQIVEFDAWPLVRREAGMYRLALLERAKTTVLDLKAIADMVNWPRVEKEIKEVAEKELYFAL